MNNVFPLKLLYFDNDILVINKPAGLRTIPDGYDTKLPCIRNILSEEYGKVWVVHRLDKDTSGILLFARNADAHRSLNSQFEHRTIHKEYQAIVHGSPMWDKKVINTPLLKNGDRYHRTIPDDMQGKKALSKIEVLTRYERNTFLSVIIESGITHQIRTHLAHYGFPIVGDTLYGMFRALPSLKTRFMESNHLLLHAQNIKFLHPKTGESMHIQSLLPPYFIEYVKNI